jgi:hypothetical protein
MYMNDRRGVINLFKRLRRNRHLHVHDVLWRS